MSNVFLYIPPEVGPWTDAVTGDTFKPGLPKFDVSNPDKLAQVNRAIAEGAGFDVSQLVSALIQIAWANITGKPSSFTPSAHTHTAADITSGQFADALISPSSVTQHQGALALAIAQISGLQLALDAKIASAEKGAAGGVATLDLSGVLPLIQIPDLDAAKTTSGVFDAARIPDLDWSKITALTRPNTLAGYGITDALTSTQVGQQIQSAIDALVGGAPAALDTLNELAAALGDDPNAITALTNAVASKLDASVWQAATATVDGFMTKQDKAKLDGIEAGATGDQTGAEIKAAYEGEVDTNAFTDAEKSKLAGVAAQATKNASDAALRDRSTHTGTQPQSSVDNLTQDLADRAKLTDLPYAAIAQYTSTDTTTDINTGADTPVIWDTAVRTDSVISVAGDAVTVNEAGLYWVYTSLAYEDRSAPEVDIRANVAVFFTVNGIARNAIGMGGYIRNADGHDEASTSIGEVLSLQVGDVVRVVARRMAGPENIYLRASESVLVVDKRGGKSPLLAAQAIGDISGLQAALDGKSPTGHSHVIADVTGLQDALNDKQQSLNTAGSKEFGVGPSRLLFSTGVATGSSVRNYFAPRNPTDTGWAWEREFGYDHNTAHWYVEGTLTHGVGGPDYWHGGNFDPATKAAASHGHAISDVTGLQDALDAAGTSGGLDIETANVTLATTTAARADPLYVTSAITVTVPAPAAGWNQPVFVSRGVTATFDFTGTTVKDKDGNIFDLTSPNNQVVGPAYLELVSRTNSEVEIWV